MHILLIVRAAHRLPAAVDRQGADALELLDQTNRVILVVVQRHETDNALQHLRTERVDVSLPRFCQNTKRICVNAFAVLPVLSKGRSDAGDLPLGVTLVETQTKAGALGSTQECDGFRVAAVDLGTQFCARRKRCRNTRLLCGSAMGTTLSNLAAKYAWVMAGLGAAGGMMRFVGFATLLRIMLSNEFWGIYFAGFALATIIGYIPELSGSALLLIAFVGIAIALYDYQTRVAIKQAAGSGFAANGGDDEDGI